MLEISNYKQVEINLSEVKIERTRGSGAGGQHKNSTDSCVIMTHKATGIKVVRDGRCQHENKASALKEITRRVNIFYETGVIGKDVEERREQIGTGERSDKRRTYRVKDNLVIDHITGKTCTLKDIQRGKIILLK